MAEWIIFNLQAIFELQALLFWKGFQLLGSSHFIWSHYTEYFSYNIARVSIVIFENAAKFVSNTYEKRAIQ